MLSQMETLTVINYQPPGSVIHKPFFKSVPRSGSVKKAQFDFPDMPIEELQSAGIGRSNLQPKTARDSKPTTYDVQASKGILAKTQAFIAEKHDSGGDTDDDLPPLPDILSTSYQRRQALPKERLLRRSILEDGDSGALHNDGSHKLRGSGSHNESIVLNGNRSKDDGDNVDTGHGKWCDVEDNCFVDANLRPFPLPEQDGLASPPAQYQPGSRNHSLAASRNQINLHDDDGTRWSASKEPAPHFLSTILDEDGGGRRDENASEPRKDSPLARQLSPSHINPQQDQGGPSHSGLKELGQDQQEDEPQEQQQEEVAGCEDGEGPRPAKRQQKLRSKPIEEALPPLRDHGINPAASPTELQLTVQAIDDNHDWEVRKVIGKEVVDGLLHYLVDWTPTLVPRHSLGHANGLVDEFEAGLQAKREGKNGQGGLGLKRGERAVEANASGGQQQKRQRGRPRRQMSGRITEASRRQSHQETRASDALGETPPQKQRRS